MSMSQQVIATGSAATGVGAVASFIAAATPVMQFCILLVTFIVGVLTAIYTYKRIKAKRFD